jgi:hypothetical protein
MQGQCAHPQQQASGCAEAACGQQTQLLTLMEQRRIACTPTPRPHAQQQATCGHAPIFACLPCLPLRLHTRPSQQSALSMQRLPLFLHLLL